MATKGYSVVTMFYCHHSSLDEGTRSRLVEGLGNLQWPGLRVYVQVCLADEQMKRGVVSRVQAYWDLSITRIEARVSLGQANQESDSNKI